MQCAVIDFDAQLDGLAAKPGDKPHRCHFVFQGSCYGAGVFRKVGYPGAKEIGDGKTVAKTVLGFELLESPIVKHYEKCDVDVLGVRVGLEIESILEYIQIRELVTTVLHNAVEIVVFLIEDGRIGRADEDGVIAVGGTFVRVYIGRKDVFIRLLAADHLLARAVGHELALGARGYLDDGGEVRIPCAGDQVRGVAIVLQEVVCGVKGRVGFIGAQSYVAIAILKVDRQHQGIGCAILTLDELNSLKIDIWRAIKLWRTETP